MMRPRVLTLLIVSVLLIATACDRMTTLPPLDPASQDPLWADVIVAHSHGLISKTASVRVAFADDVVAPSQVDGDATGALSIEPHVAGVVSFHTPREIRLVPDEHLESGQRYRVTLTKRGLRGIPESLTRYQFDFQVIEQRFEIEIGGLTALGGDAALTLNGSLRTADVESADAIERVLVGRFRGEEVVVSWRHSPDQKSHEFAIAGLLRQDGPETLQLTWDGAPLGVDERGARSIDIPHKDAFEITKVRTVRTAPASIRVYFSQSLDPAQNLRGLVRLGDGEPRTRIQTNVLTIYPNAGSSGRVELELRPGIRSEAGDSFAAPFTRSVALEAPTPKVRFVGKGVVVPGQSEVTIPFEAKGVRSVQVTAFQIFESNVGAFLQRNALDGSRELGRVGRPLWRRTLPLASPEPGRWNRYGLDTTELFRKHPDGLIRLTLSISRRDSVMECPDAPPLDDASDLTNMNVPVLGESNWIYYERRYRAVTDGSTWSDRDNPCKDAYFQYTPGAKDGRNVLSSNIGLLAKREPGGRLWVATTDLRTSEPMRGVRLSVRDFQNQEIASTTTNAEGMSRVETKGVPFMIIAAKSGDTGYLRLAKGAALPVSHLDVGGENVTSGIKGFIYGERGVWRPGDDIHLTLVVEDATSSLPRDHPASLELLDPKGQITAKRTNTSPVGRFYKFVMTTAEDAPTGLWTARASVGGREFRKSIKIETVMPNRLRVDLDFGAERLEHGSTPIVGALFGQWLSGASASGLDADVSVRLRPVTTRFDAFNGFVFDDPTRRFPQASETLFEGSLGEDGFARFGARVALGGAAPGMLRASFESRIFERGGAFSMGRTTLPFSPYESYIGVKLPKGDSRRGSLLTNVDHAVAIASVTAAGEPVSIPEVRVTLHKIDWRWWWDKSGESLAQYASGTHVGLIADAVISTEDGSGSWNLRVDREQWGRYLLRVCDPSGGHCTGRVFYIDWPGWSGRGQKGAGPGANTLSLVTDKTTYAVGDVAEVELPDASAGRALVTVESGTRIVDAKWVTFDAQSERPRLRIPIEEDMTPNVYLSVTLIQPHDGKENDRPIRLYGSIPILVTDARTVVSPVITAADEWRPESSPSFGIHEGSGRPMTYTVAIVDEGLLGLTSFQTPRPHAHFFKREALGITTWDLFDDVIGAYGGELERLLALGGGASGDVEPEKEKRRFPPVVRFLGPFELAADERRRHTIDLPQYVGAVRVMVVAGSDRAYGQAEQSVFVRAPLMLLPTLPRVVGPDETITVPVATFVMDDSLRKVNLSIETDEHFHVKGSDSIELEFSGADEKLGSFELQTADALGKARVRVTASSGVHRAEAIVDIDVRSPNPRTARVLRATIEPGESWSTSIEPHGIPGTNRVSFTVSAVPPMDLDRRLDYLIRYPHGCLEQTTSAMFPQLFLPRLTKLDADRIARIERHVSGGIHRLRRFQTADGGFSYWPGYHWEYGTRNNWATNYVGHFLVEAERLGYDVPVTMLTEWVNHQKSAAHAWVGGDSRSELDQAYRLYTLALAKAPEVGAMNRLREAGSLPAVARWQLAAAYRLAGLPSAAEELVRGAPVLIEHDGRPDRTFGSTLRDRSLVLMSLLALERRGEAEALVSYLSSQLASDRYLSTHAVAFGLMALAHFGGDAELGAPELEYVVSTSTPTRLTMEAPILSVPLQVRDEGDSFRLDNASDRTLFANITLEGTPPPGDEIASSSSMSLSVTYRDPDGNEIDVHRLEQGADFVAELAITNTSKRDLTELALSQTVPSGWEILSTVDASGSGIGDRVEFEDIRDDRVYRYFELDAGETKRFVTNLNAAYLGRFYLPSVSAEAMYDAGTHARTAGSWVEVAR